jgi:NAD(P)-dependent dehydrogenase (short-subunit alcohol dehydrogenase family)
MTGAAISIDNATAADTIRSVKERVFAANRDFPVRRQRLVYCGGPGGMEPLADDETLGGAGLSAYAASKGAVEALMRTLALEGRRYRIVCNTLSPYAHTQMTAAHLSPELARALPAQDLGPVLLWLLSSDCPLQGEVVVAGGRRLARGAVSETAAIERAPGEDLAAAWARLCALPGRPQPDANQAFVAFMQGAAP